MAEEESMIVETKEEVNDYSEPLTILKGNGLKRTFDQFDQHVTLKQDAPRPPKHMHLPYSTSQTGLVYDVRMRFHVDPDNSSSNDIHPEDPRRIHAIFEALVNAGLAWRPGAEPAEFYMGRIDTRRVTEEEVCRVHTKAHWDWVQSLRHKPAAELRYERQYVDTPMDSVYMSPNTPFCAELSAGGAIEACRAIMNGKVKNAFAVIRPPGHHAEREDAKGFCFFDNVSIAAKACQDEFGAKCRKILILDFDVHHGNAIQQAHYDNPNILYISLHVFKNGTFYPEGTYRDGRQSYGDHLHCGVGAGLGKNVNIPWSKLGMGDADYIYAFREVVMPIANEFDPDLVMVAAGFDAARGDMLGGCDVTPAGYAHMIHMLMSLAHGRVAVCLEGGYNLDSIARSGVAVAKTLMGEAPPPPDSPVPLESGVSDVKTVVRQQSKYWASLYPKDISDRTISGQRADDIVRTYQQTTLWNDHQMTSLFIRSDQLQHYQNQVLATLDYMEARPLLVLLHDPPELLASPDPVTGQLDLHNTWLTDGLKSYIDEAIKLGFAVIDVAIPRRAEPSDEHQDVPDARERMQDAARLLTYIYENYIEVGASEQVFLLGTNIGHGAITSFLKTHEETAPERVMATIHFVQNVALQPCRSATTEDLSLWYWRNSLVFVAIGHYYWHSEAAAKPRKKYGKLKHSLENNMSDMLIKHKDEVFELLLEETEEWRANKLQGPSKPKPLDDDLPEIVLSSPTRKMPPISNFALSSPKASTPLR